MRTDRRLNKNGQTNERPRQEKSPLKSKLNVDLMGEKYNMSCFRLNVAAPTNCVLFQPIWLLYNGRYILKYIIVSANTMSANGMHALLLYDVLLPLPLPLPMKMCISVFFLEFNRYLHMVSWNSNEFVLRFLAVVQWCVFSILSFYSSILWRLVSFIRPRTLFYQPTKWNHLLCAALCLYG